MTIEGFYDPDRKPWVVQLLRETSYGSFVVDYTWTPENPGPLVGTWSFSYLVNGECEHGELGLYADPMWPPDSRVVLVWEQPDTTLPPDFIGAVGLIRGATDSSGGNYTLPVIGLLDVDMLGRAGSYQSFNFPGLYVAGSITALGVSTLPPKRGENVQTHHARIMEPYTDASAGVRGDGTRVIGRAVSGILALSAATDGPVYELSLSGYERQKYVNETDADPGPEWALLSTNRSRPTSLTPRVLAASATGKNAETGTVNLIQPDVDNVPPISWQTNFLPIGQTIDKNYYTPAARVTDAFPAQPSEETVRAFSIPIADLVRSSSNRKDQVNAAYTLKALSAIVGAVLTLTEYDVMAGSYADANIDSFYYNTAYLPGGLDVTARHWISPVADTYDPQNALSTVVIARAGFRANQDGNLPPQDWSVLLKPEDDFISDLYSVLNSGQYWWKVALVMKTTANVYQYTRKDGVDSTQPQRGWEKAVWQSGRWRVITKLDMPKMVEDVLAGSIPAENLPDGWNSGTTSPPTAQGKVAGRLRGPAKLTDIKLPDGSTVEGPITQYTLSRTFDSYSTSFQTGARQTRVLTAGEADLEAVRQRRLMTELGSGPL